MSVKLVFSVYDSKAEAFLQPMFFVTRAVAVRAFGAAVRDDVHEFSKFAEDYTLFELGSFDEEAGKFELHDAPKAIVVGLTMKSMARNLEVV